MARYPLSAVLTGFVYERMYPYRKVDRRRGCDSGIGSVEMALQLGFPEECYVRRAMALDMLNDGAALSTEPGCLAFWSSGCQKTVHSIASMLSQSWVEGES